MSVDPDRDNDNDDNDDDDDTIRRWWMHLLVRDRVRAALYRPPPALPSLPTRRAPLQEVFDDTSRTRVETLTSPCSCTAVHMKT
jgi:hypothetical protein